jgi:DinB family protein
MSHRAQALAERVEQGAHALATYAEGLTDAEWSMRLPKDGRTIGVIIHHVASVYPLEVQLAQTLASGNSISGVTMDGIAKMNAQHAREHGGVDRSETLALLRRNSKAAADAIRVLSDEQLDAAAPVSLNGDAPLTAQFFVEDHALRHSFHHLSRIRAAVGR